MGVSLPLERDVPVGLVPVAILRETDEPFQDVKQIKRHIQQLLHLGCMDALVVHYLCVYPGLVTNPKSAEKVYAKPFRRKSAFDYLRFSQSRSLFSRYYPVCLLFTEEFFLVDLFGIIAGTTRGLEEITPGISFFLPHYCHIIFVSHEVESGLDSHGVAHGG